ncbi:MAG: DUF4007 family protein [Peptoniphilaceae bacterium]|jgi:hypothetical protein
MAMKFRGHDTFFIRKGWLNKGIKHISAKPDVFVDREENPMDVLGMGSNMVKSLRYWMQATGISVEPMSGKRTQKFTSLGDEIHFNDKYIEELGTLCLLHYRLATNKELATAWFYFFNYFTQKEFTRDDYIEALKNFIAMENEPPVALRSLNEDFNCIINTYVPRIKSNPNKVTAENNIDCPLGELGLIDIVHKGRDTLYRKSSIKPDYVNPWIALSIIIEQSDGEKSIRLNDLLNNPCNIGKVFNLDTITLLEILRKIEKIDEIKIIRTAGLDIVKIKNDYSFIECVAKFYESIKN